ncbi:MAG: DUF2927 domain-containing protein [Alphaproteobacteria bacterium]
MRKLLAALAVFLWLAPGLTGPAAARPPEPMQTPPLAEMVGQYRRVALSAEFGGAYRRGRIIKWNGPIVARLRGPNAQRYAGEIVRHFSLLARLTGLRFRVLGPGAPRGARANMTITFIDNGGRGPANLERACRAEVFTDRYLVIRRARVTINADWKRLRRHCILEEITQTLGLMNDSSYLFPSIFNDDSRQQRLSPWDRMVIRAHYDRRIRPGMTWPAAEPIVRRNISRQLGSGGEVGVLLKR